MDVDGDDWQKTLRDTADGHVPLRPTATSMINGNDDVYQLANKAFPKGHEPHRLGPIHEEDSGDYYRKFVLTRNAATKAGIHPDAPQPPSPQSKSAYTLGNSGSLLNFFHSMSP